MLQNIYCNRIFSKKLIRSINDYLKHIITVKYDLIEYRGSLTYRIIGCLNTFVISAKYICVLNML